MSKNREFSGVSWISGLMLGVGVSNVCYGLVVESFQEDDKREQLENVQVYNEQIGNSLAENFERVDDLVLNYETDTFSFETRDGATVEVCMGNYDVGQERAYITGELSCSRQLEIVEVEE